MKNILYFISFCLIVACNNKNGEKSIPKIGIEKHSVSKLIETKVKPNIKLDYSLYFQEAKEYCKKNNLNQNVFILIDLGVHSGLKRFFIYDFKINVVRDSCMVSHGCGDAPWGQTSSKQNAPISNVPDSHCSSIGKYLIKSRGVSQWGIKINYLLEGMETSNSNAKRRSIVLHSWEAISNAEVFPEGTAEGWGCPAVSNEDMKMIDELLQVNKRVLMWIIKTEPEE